MPIKRKRRNEGESQTTEWLFEASDSEEFPAKACSEHLNKFGFVVIRNSTPKNILSKLQEVDMPIREEIKCNIARVKKEGDLEEYGPVVKVDDMPAEIKKPARNVIDHQILFMNQCGLFEESSVRLICGNGWFRLKEYKRRTALHCDLSDLLMEAISHIPKNTTDSESESILPDELYDMQEKAESEDIREVITRDFHIDYSKCPLWNVFQVIQDSTSLHSKIAVYKSSHQIGDWRKKHFQSRGKHFLLRFANCFVLDLKAGDIVIMHWLTWHLATEQKGRVFAHLRLSLDYRIFGKLLHSIQIQDPIRAHHSYSRCDRRRATQTQQFLPRRRSMTSSRPTRFSKRNRKASHNEDDDVPTENDCIGLIPGGNIKDSAKRALSFVYAEESDTSDKAKLSLGRRMEYVQFFMGCFRNIRNMPRSFKAARMCLIRGKM